MKDKELNLIIKLTWLTFIIKEKYGLQKFEHAN